MREVAGYWKFVESCGKWQKLRYRNYRNYIVHSIVSDVPFPIARLIVCKKLWIYAACIFRRTVILVNIWSIFPHNNLYYLKLNYLLLKITNILLQASTKTPIKICITGGAGQIAYSLLLEIATGKVFGNDQVIFI